MSSARNRWRSPPGARPPHRRRGSQRQNLAAILNRRFNPAMDAFKAACDSDPDLGKSPRPSCYIKWFRDQAYYDSAAWRGTKALDGGGALMNQGIHTIDALLHLAVPLDPSGECR